MQKCVLISIQPKWCELIACGKKTIEVRKSYPTLVVGPFKCLMYQTKTKWAFDLLRGLGFKKTAERLELGLGKVIGEFTCDYIIIANCGEYKNIPLAECRLDAYELMDYADGGKVYGWHIKDPIIYDEPKPLSEFVRVGCRGCKDKDTYHCLRHCYGERKLVRPPQSWCYVKNPDSDERES